MRVNLADAVFKEDTAPILPGCTCYACTNHTRAYVNHLFRTHEMLAYVLLHAHNLHHELTFFQHIRDHIDGGTFEAYRAWFLQQTQLPGRGATASSSSAA